MQEQHPHLAALEAQHKALDSEIGDLEKRPYIDATEVKTLKRKKLYIKQEMANFS